VIRANCATIDKVATGMILRWLRAAFLKEGAMLRCIRLAAVSLIVVLTTTAAGAVELCAGRPDLVALLKDNFGEIVVAQGLSSRGHLVEVFVSPAGNWTILLSRADGLSCLVDAGDPWVTASSAGASRDAAQR
jgi:hypothetical protein